MAPGAAGSPAAVSTFSGSGPAATPIRSATYRPIQPTRSSPDGTRIFVFAVMMNSAPPRPSTERGIGMSVRDGGAAQAANDTTAVKTTAAWRGIREG